MTTRWAGHVTKDATDRQTGQLSRAAVRSDEICAFRRRWAQYTAPAASQSSGRVADLLARRRVVGWFQGRMEFGPRALGARSIIGDARSPKMQATMNLKIKFRESFRPFAPIVLQERAHEWFEHRRGAGKPLHAAGRAGARENIA